MCRSCKIPLRHVFLQSALLNGMTDKDVSALLNDCSIEKPIHVLKISKDQTYCHINFENEAGASSFHRLYHNNNHILSKKFKNIIIKPSRKNGVTSAISETQDISLCQRRLDEDTSGWCTCLIPSPSSIVNTTDSNDNNDTNNENVSAASFYVNTVDKHKTTLKGLTQDLKDEIKEDEERTERKRRKLNLLQDAYGF